MIKFNFELPKDCADILNDEYPDKSYQAAIKAFIRTHKPETKAGQQYGEKGNN